MKRVVDTYPLLGPFPGGGPADKVSPDPLDIDGAWPARAVSRTAPATNSTRGLRSRRAPNIYLGTPTLSLPRQCGKLGAASWVVGFGAWLRDEALPQPVTEGIGREADMVVRHRLGNLLMLEIWMR